MVATFSTLILIGWRYDGRRTPGASALVGATSGLLIGVTSIAGPPVILYLLSGPDSARYNRATLTVYFVLVTLATYPMLFVNGLLTLGTLLFAASLVPVLMAGVWLGSRLFTGASETLYRRVALVFLLSVAAVAIAA